MVGAGAKVLGPFRVGDNARVAAGAVVLDEVPANSTAVGVPARIVRVNGQSERRPIPWAILDQMTRLPDPGWPQRADAGSARRNGRLGQMDFEGIPQQRSGSRRCCTANRSDAECSKKKETRT